MDVLRWALVVGETEMSTQQRTHVVSPGIVNLDDQLHSWFLAGAAVPATAGNRFHSPYGAVGTC